jgi:hypothetical protein
MSLTSEELTQHIASSERALRNATLDGVERRRLKSVRAMARVMLAAQRFAKECHGWRSAAQLGAAMRELRTLLRSSFIPDDFREIVSAELDRLLLTLPALLPASITSADVAALWAEAGAPTLAAAH